MSSALTSTPRTHAADLVTNASSALAGGCPLLETPIIDLDPTDVEATAMRLYLYRSGLFRSALDRQWGTGACREWQSSTMYRCWHQFEFTPESEEANQEISRRMRKYVLRSEPNLCPLLPASHHAYRNGQLHFMMAPLYARVLLQHFHKQLVSYLQGYHSHEPAKFPAAAFVPLHRFASPTPSSASAGSGSGSGSDANAETGASATATATQSQATRHSGALYRDDFLMVFHLLGVSEMAQNHIIFPNPNHRENAVRLPEGEMYLGIRHTSLCPYHVAIAQAFRIPSLSHPALANDEHNERAVLFRESQLAVALLVNVWMARYLTPRALEDLMGDVEMALSRTLSIEEQQMIFARAHGAGIFAHFYDAGRKVIDYREQERQRQQGCEESESGTQREGDGEGEEDISRGSTQCWMFCVDDGQPYSDQRSRISVINSQSNSHA